ncbi:hypothetical protein ESCO_000209 [Escovopsis weberi]|uniref:Uncharacterized protein n=1 Tax=Escovopsis weberi TaxID=150374 RepID=A0A0M9VTF9_ESCWE|nr:hypothetical protein ESCO_000209 [Escovopsis weberi]
MPDSCVKADGNAAKDAQAKVSPEKPAEEGAAQLPRFLELTPPLAKPAPAAEEPAPASKPASPEKPAALEKPMALRKPMTPDKEAPKVKVKEVPAADAKDGGDADKIPPHIRKVMQERENGLAAAKARLAFLQEQHIADADSDYH